MDLHGQIMNLQCASEPYIPLCGGSPEVREVLAYKVGYRDARHAAADLALKADRLSEAADDLLRLTPDDSSTEWNVSLMRLRDARNALVSG